MPGPRPGDFTLRLCFWRKIVFLHIALEQRLCYDSSHFKSLHQNASFELLGCEFLQEVLHRSVGLAAIFIYWSVSENMANVLIHNRCSVPNFGQFANSGYPSCHLLFVSLEIFSTVKAPRSDTRCQGWGKRYK